MSRTPASKRSSCGGKVDAAANPSNVETVKHVAPRIEPLLAGQRPEIVGAVLADLLATWLAGHFADDSALTGELRLSLLEAHIETVFELVPVNERKRP